MQLKYTLQRALAAFAQYHRFLSFSNMEEGTSDRRSASALRPQWHKALQKLSSEAAQREPQQQGIGWVAAVLLLVSLVLAATMQQRQILRYVHCSEDSALRSEAAPSHMTLQLERGQKSCISAVACRLDKELREVQRQAQLAQQSQEQSAANLELSPAITPHSSLAEELRVEPRVVSEADAQGPSFELEGLLHVCPGPTELLQSDQNTWWSRCIAAATLTGTHHLPTVLYMLSSLPVSLRLWEGQNSSTQQLPGLRALINFLRRGSWYQGA